MTARSAGDLLAPRPLAAGHRVAEFDSGEPALDDWLRRRAKSNQATGASRTYVVTLPDGGVVGYYALAAGAIPLRAAPGPIRRNMPDPIPMVVLGRLAVDRTWHRRGLGVALLRDATERAIAASRELGVRGLLVHAISDAARAFYEHHGFVATPDNPMTLILSLKDL